MKQAQQLSIWNKLRGRLHTQHRLYTF